MNPRTRLLKALEVLNALSPHITARPRPTPTSISADDTDPDHQSFNAAWLAAYREASAAAAAYATSMKPPRRSSNTHRRRTSP